jgi:hypothetical protein
MTKTMFAVHAPDHNGDLVVAKGFSDGTVIVSLGPDDYIEMPAELVRQVRAELESQALERVAAYARERAEDMLVARDRAGTNRVGRLALERCAEAFREMATKAQAEKES